MPMTLDERPHMSKKLYQFVCFALLVMLIASNAWWAYSAFDASITDKYQRQELYERGHALRQALHMLSALARATTEDEVRAVGQELDGIIFEKEGILWVGWLGFAFDAGGHIEYVRPCFDLLTGERDQAAMSGQ